MQFLEGTKIDPNRVLVSLTTILILILFLLVFITMQIQLPRKKRQNIIEKYENVNKNKIIDLNLSNVKKHSVTFIKDS